MSKPENVSKTDHKMSVCDILKEDTSEVIRKLESQTPSLFQNYSNLYTAYLHMFDDLFGTCYISEKEFFDKMKIEDLQSAVVAGMELNLAEIETIANNTEEPTFESTILAMERSGKELDRVFAYYGIIRSNISTPESRKIQADLAPKLSEFSSKISKNEKLFQRVKAVYDKSLKTPLEADQQRVVELTYKGFEMSLLKNY